MVIARCVTKSVSREYKQGMVFFFVLMLMFWFSVMITPLIAAPKQIVTATASVKLQAAPDQVIIHGSLRNHAPNAREAMQKNSDSLTAIIAFLGQQGISVEEIQTTSLSLHPQYQQNQYAKGREFIGFEVVNNLRLQLSDLEILPTVVDGLLENGLTTIDNVKFSVSDTRSQFHRARHLAVIAVRKKLEQMIASASQGKGQLRKILLLEERENRHDTPLYQERALAQPMSVAAGGMKTFEVRVKARASWTDKQKKDKKQNHKQEKEG